ncbi:MAG: SMC-Scp complex subunit ScpB [Bacteroidota bacterium]
MGESNLQVLEYEFVDGTRLISVVEALVFASPEPVSSSKICKILAEADEHIEVDPEEIETLIDKLNDRYEENGFAFYIQNVAGGYAFATKNRFYKWLSVFQHENAYRRLSQSAIEALAIVAYKQPITKPEVDHIRGVDSGYILRQLMEKELIQVSGRADAPGKPLLYKTTQYFLKHFGINSVKELPKPREIEEILSDDDMAEHRQFLMERQAELLEDQRVDDEDAEDSTDPAEGEEESADSEEEQERKYGELEQAAQQLLQKQSSDDEDEDNQHHPSQIVSSRPKNLNKEEVETTSDSNSTEDSKEAEKPEEPAKGVDSGSGDEEE